MKNYRDFFSCNYFWRKLYGDNKINSRIIDSFSPQPKTSRSSLVVVIVIVVFYGNRSSSSLFVVYIFCVCDDDVRCTTLSLHHFITSSTTDFQQQFRSFNAPQNFGSTFNKN